MTEKNSPPTDNQIDKAYQQATKTLVPSLALDKKILNLAKQQAKVQALRPKIHRWTAAPWWASAASFTCVGLIGWWLWGQSSQPALDNARYSELAMMDSMSEQQNIVEFSPPPSKRAASSKQESLQLDRKLATKVASGSRTINTSLPCIREHLHQYRLDDLESLSLTSAQALKLQQQNTDQRLNWLDQTWLVYQQQPQWWIQALPTQSEDTTNVLILPANIKNSCKPSTK